MATSEQRQASRGPDGRYSNMTACPRCGKRKLLEPAYTTDEGGVVSPRSKWAGGFICESCIRRESKV